MTMSGTFAPDAGALATLLDAGEGPVIVLDPCGVLWAQFWLTARWSSLWQAWRLAPGQTQEGDVWNVLDALKGVSAPEGCTSIAAALFPAGEHSELTRQLMACVLAFADDSGYFSGQSSGLGGLAGQLWADDLWAALARWSRKYPYHPALQTARSLLTQNGAGESVQAIRDRMAIYHHPHVAESFAGCAGLNLSTLRQRPGQIIFLTPDIRCMETPALTSVYAFLMNALCTMGALHCVTFALLEPTLTAKGDAT